VERQAQDSRGGMADTDLPPQLRLAGIWKRRKNALCPTGLLLADSRTDSSSGAKGPPKCMHTFVAHCLNLVEVGALEAFS
jgi:hypothetical protein